MLQALGSFQANSVAYIRAGMVISALEVSAMVQLKGSMNAVDCKNCARKQLVIN